MTKAILISGSGRSGTSLIAKTLEGLGYFIPGEQVRADETNPAGFGEPQWMVDLHNKYLQTLRMINTDARPEILNIGFSRQFDDEWIDEAAETLASYLSTVELEEQIGVVLKDPRIIYFLPLWENVLDRLNISPCHILALRNPYEVVASKSRWYSVKTT